MSKIYDLTPAYRIGRRYVVFTFKRFYSKFIILGKENIPSQGPVIFAPNHQNALMDALVILASTPWKLSNVFIARGDIFKKGFFAKALRFLKILPAFRMRDGIGSLGKNEDTFDEAREVLEMKNALGIMPEGSQSAQRKLRPLVKGIFRIAFTSQEKIGDKDEVKIIPVGIDYSSIVDFGAEVIVNYGPPISVKKYMPLYEENQAVAINQIRNELSAGLQKQMVDLAAEKYYDAFETIVDTADGAAALKLYSNDDSASRFYARRQIAALLTDVEKNRPHDMEKLAALCKEFQHIKSETGCCASTLEKPMALGGIVLGVLLLLITLPVFASGFILNMFPFFLPGIIRKKMGVKYEGFFSSFDYVLGAVFTFPGFYLIQTVLFAVFSPSPWWMVPVFAVMQYILGRLAFRWAKAAAKYVDNIRCRVLKRQKPQLIENLQRLRGEIVDWVLKGL